MTVSNPITAGWKNAPLFSADIVPGTHSPVEPQNVVARSYGNRFTNVGRSYDAAIAAAQLKAKEFAGVSREDPNFGINPAQAVLQGKDGAFYTTSVGAPVKFRNGISIPFRLPIDGQIRVDGHRLDLGDLLTMERIQPANSALVAVVGAERVRAFHPDV